jgi:quinol monooxygenase YgiN
MHDGPVRILATFVPAPGRVTEVLEVLTAVAVGTRDEPGNEQYDLYGSEHDGHVRFHLVERYRDVEAIDAHRASDHYRAYRAAIADLLDAPIDVAVLRDPATFTEPDA